MTRRMFPFALLCLLLISGCISPSPEVVFHTLSPMSQEATRLASVGKPMALEIMPVQLPELLQRSQLVVLDGTDTYRLSATHRWGNTLEQDMQRVLTENLAALLGSDSVVPYPLGDRVQAAYRISLEVQQCEGAPGGTLTFRATWMVTQPSDGRLVLRHRWRLQEPVQGGNIEDLVSAHSRVMSALSQEMGKALQALAH